MSHYRTNTSPVPISVVPQTPTVPVSWLEPTKYWAAWDTLKVRWSRAQVDGVSLGVSAFVSLEALTACSSAQAVKRGPNYLLNPIEPRQVTLTEMLSEAELAGLRSVFIFTTLEIYEEVFVK